MGRTVYHLVRTGLALAFLGAEAVKLVRPEVFAVTIRAFGLMPDSVAEALSLALPCLEIAAGLMLLFKIRGGLALTTGLLMLFVTVLAYGLRLGLDIDCGCYGPSDPKREAFGSMRQALWRDGVMLASAAYLYWWQGKRGRRGNEPSA